MKRRHFGALVILALLVLGSARQARSEVYAEVGSDGRFTAVRAVAPRAHPGRVWEPTGAADSSAYVLNPNGNLLGDGPPDFAVEPLSGTPLAVWAKRVGRDYDIVASSFVNGSWTAPVLVNAQNDADDLDPRIVVRQDGIAVIVWWVKGPTPSVRMAYRDGGAFSDVGTISPQGVRAKQPSVKQAGEFTIVAFRTPKGIEIRTFVVSDLTTAAFADGPTPFPQFKPPIANEPPGGDGGDEDPGLMEPPGIRLP